MITIDIPVLSYYSSALDPPLVCTALRVKTSVDHHALWTWLPSSLGSCLHHCTSQCPSQCFLASPHITSPLSGSRLLAPPTPFHQKEWTFGHFVQCHSLKKVPLFVHGQAPPWHFHSTLFFFFKIFYRPFNYVNAIRWLLLWNSIIGIVLTVWKPHKPLLPVSFVHCWYLPMKVLPFDCYTFDFNSWKDVFCL